MKFITAPKTRNLLAALSLLILAGVLAVAAWNYYLHSSPGEPAGTVSGSGGQSEVSGVQTGEGTVILTVEPGDSLRGIAQELSDRGMLRLPRLFTLWATVSDQDRGIRAGEYDIPSGTSPAGLLELLTSGRTRQYPLTLVEGWTFRQALEAMWRTERITPTLHEHSDQDILDAMGVDYPSPEGLLFPDTYFYESGTTDLAIVQRAWQRLESVLATEWEGRLGALPYEEPYQALIMASIIEKESGRHHERQRIASVFVNRLDLGMRLQSDPTVIYGMGASYDGDIRSQDLRDMTPYNTYRINGLPPTPIALAGRESIMASLQPESGPWLYFVSRGDGSHQFSLTLEEHNAAVRQYQLQNPAQEPNGNGDSKGEVDGETGTPDEWNDPGQQESLEIE